MSFPRSVVAALAVAMALSFVGGLVGIIAGVLSASLMMAYGILGFAVLHAITRGIKSRPFVLGGVYASVAVFGWPMLALCLLGLAETAFDLRARVARKRGPRHPDLKNSTQQTDNQKFKSRSNDNGSDPARAHRQTWPNGRCRARQGRLRPQFPAAARQGAARDRR